MLDTCSGAYNYKSCGHEDILVCLHPHIISIRGQKYLTYLEYRF